jgi:hypothetical protein
MDDKTRERLERRLVLAEAGCCIHGDGVPGISECDISSPCFVCRTSEMRLAMETAVSASKSFEARAEKAERERDALAAEIATAMANLESWKCRGADPAADTLEDRIEILHERASVREHGCACSEEDACRFVRERDEARAAANANKSEYALAFDRVQNLERALSESQAQCAAMREALKEIHVMRQLDDGEICSCGGCSQCLSRIALSTDAGRALLKERDSWKVLAKSLLDERYRTWGCWYCGEITRSDIEDPHLRLSTLREWAHHHVENDCPEHPIRALLRERDNLKERAEYAEKFGLAVADDLRSKLALVRTKRDDVWLWQGDEYDHPESLCCPVVMTADQFRSLLRERDDLRAALAATWPSEEAIAQHRDAALLAEVERLREVKAAVLEIRDSGCWAWDATIPDDGEYPEGCPHCARLIAALAGGDKPRPESATEHFDRLAEEFWQETHIMAPGKSVAPEMGERWTNAERQDAWDKWIIKRWVAGGEGK